MVQSGSERRFRSLCGRIRISLARSAAFWTGFERSARVAGKISLMQQISHNRPAADQGNISVARHHLRQGEYSNSSTHVQAVLPTVGLQRACGYGCEQVLLALDHSEELFPKLRTRTGLMVQAKNKTQNWAIH